ncbi:HDOD domain-containing protein [Aquitalea sp. ASV15]|uniref:HDOD domain-containing protein n=1 Tax=Aquitalea sp. ASV15 TaxID=2795104 RepID=UPI0018EB934F
MKIKSKETYQRHVKTCKGYLALQYSCIQNSSMKSALSLQDIQTITCGDGSPLLLASNGQQRYVMLPSSPARMQNRLRHSLLAWPEQEVSLKEGNFACYVRGNSKLLAELEPDQLNDREKTGIACDIIEALLHLQLSQQALPHFSLEHILINEQFQIQLLGQHASLHQDETQQKRNTCQTGQILHWLYSGQTAAGQPLQTLRPDLDTELAKACQVLLDEEQHNKDRVRSVLAQLQDWLLRQQHSSLTGGQQDNTLKQLLERMRHSRDFPALSQAISAINHIGNADRERLQVLADIILKDPSLTSKLLKVVNSANFNHFGGTVSTISRAIVILGFNTIRNLALTLLLFEHMNNHDHARDVYDITIKALFCGLLARQLAFHFGSRDAEEMLICGMFQQLGELLCAFYFHEEHLRIQQRCQQGGDPEQVAREILGTSRSTLAAETTRRWNFPEHFTQSLLPLPSGPVRQPHGSNERLRMFGNLANELTQALSGPDHALLGNVQGILIRYERALTCDFDILQSIISRTQHDFTDYLQSWKGEHASSKQTQTLRSISLTHRPHADPVETNTMPQHTLSTEVVDKLSNGIQDVTSALVGTQQLQDVLRMILEIMHDSVGFDHVMLCTRDPKQNIILGRFGIGDKINILIKHFRINPEQLDNTFSIALERNVDVFIDDAQAPAITNHIPRWYQQLNLAQTFIIFPLVLEKRKIGFLYGDKKQAHSLPLRPDELNLLKTLRNQALLAIRQKQS